MNIPQHLQLKTGQHSPYYQTRLQTQPLTCDNQPDPRAPFAVLYKGKWYYANYSETGRVILRHPHGDGTRAVLDYRSIDALIESGHATRWAPLYSPMLKDAPVVNDEVKARIENLESELKALKQAAGIGV